MMPTKKPSCSLISTSSSKKSGSSTAKAMFPLAKKIRQGPTVRVLQGSRKDKTVKEDQLFPNQQTQRLHRIHQTSLTSTIQSQLVLPPKVGPARSAHWLIRRHTFAAKPVKQSDRPFLLPHLLLFPLGHLPPNELHPLHTQATPESSTITARMSTTLKNRRKRTRSQTSNP